MDDKFAAGRRIQKTFGSDVFTGTITGFHTNDPDGSKHPRWRRVKFDDGNLLQVNMDLCRLVGPCPHCPPGSGKQLGHKGRHIGSDGHKKLVAQMGGKFPRPRGRGRNGMRWDGDTGEWVPGSDQEDSESESESESEKEEVSESEAESESEEEPESEEESESGEHDRLYASFLTGLRLTPTALCSRGIRE